MWKFFYVNARHLETYPSTYFSPNTHLTGEALGLFYLGTLLPEFKEANRWRDHGLRTLLGQLSRHVQPDGVYFEQASYYHRYTTDFYLHLRVLLGIEGHSIPLELNAKLQLLLDHLEQITRPDGTTPLFGDDDGGRFLPLESRPANDFRSTLATGAAVFERADYKFVSGGACPETLWLLGTVGVEMLDRLQEQEPAHQSQAFPSGGYYVLRDGWKPDSNYMLFDCGPHGHDNCGHAHADALSFELSVNGRTLLVDPGTYTYTGSKDSRDWFRSTAAHNTVSVDGESSSVPAGPFSWTRIARTRCSSWISQPRFDFVDASHDGFSRLQSPATHWRSILFLRKDYWVIQDGVESDGRHRAQFWVHWDSGVPPVQIEENSIECADVLRISAFAGNGGWRREAGWVSHRYGMKKEAPVFSFSMESDGSASLTTFLLPRGASAKFPIVREVIATGGRAFEIDVQGKRDLLLLRHIHGTTVAPRVESSGIVSDFSLSWLRFDRTDSRPQECILIGGESLELDGKRLEIQQGASNGFYYVRN
jgi:hypothetical protein